MLYKLPITEFINIPQSSNLVKNTDQTFNTIIDQLTKIKNEITKIKVQYPEDKFPEKANALDDATSAVDLTIHHLLDIMSD